MCTIHLMKKSNSLMISWEVSPFFLSKGCCQACSLSCLYYWCISLEGFHHLGWWYQNSKLNRWFRNYTIIRKIRFQLACSSSWPKSSPGYQAYCSRSSSLILRDLHKLCRFCKSWTLGSWTERREQNYRPLLSQCRGMRKYRNQVW